MINALIFTPDRNVHANDWAGAFRPASLQFAHQHGVPESQRCAIDVSQPQSEQRGHVRRKIETCAGLEMIAFFCHGWLNGIQLGITRGYVPGLVSSIAAVANPAKTFRVALYACSAGGDVDAGAPGGDGDFADQLRDELCLAGFGACQVDAHATRGHTSQNPHVRRFVGDGSPTGGQGGSWIVAPRSVHWPVWQRALRTGDLQYRFPLMSVADVHRELLGVV